MRGPEALIAFGRRAYVARRPQAQAFGVDEAFKVLIRVRQAICYDVIWDKERVERKLAAIAAARTIECHDRTCTQGLVRFGAESH